MAENVEPIVEGKRNTKFFWIMALTLSVTIVIGWFLFPYESLLIKVGFALTLAAFVDIIRAYIQKEKPHPIVWFFLIAPLWLVIIITIVLFIGLGVYW